MSAKTTDKGSRRTSLREQVMLAALETVSGPQSLRKNLYFRGFAGSSVEEGPTRLWA